MKEVFQLLALILPTEVTFNVHSVFLEKWSGRPWSTAPNVEFEYFSSSFLTVFELQVEETPFLPIGYVLLVQRPINVSLKT